MYKMKVFVAFLAIGVATSAFAGDSQSSTAPPHASDDVDPNSFLQQIQDNYFDNYDSLAKTANDGLVRGIRMFVYAVRTEYPDQILDSVYNLKDVLMGLPADKQQKLGIDKALNVISQFEVNEEFEGFEPDGERVKALLRASRDIQQNILNEANSA